MSNRVLRSRSHWRPFQIRFTITCRLRVVIPVGDTPVGRYNETPPARLELNTMTFNERPIRLARTARFACAALVGATLIVTGASQQAHRPSAARSKSRPTPAAPSEAGVPFSGGERLSFRVLWSKFSVNAATLEFAVAEHRNFFGHPAWHFQARAQTVDTMHIVYPLDDQFDSYTDAVTLTSLQYEMYLHEAGKQENNSWRMTTGSDPAPPDVAAARVLPGTRDPIDFLYVLRATDWKTTPEIRAPVFDGHQLYEVVARLGQAVGQATVPAGQFDASRVDVRLFEHGQEVADTRFSLWLARDAARTPVLIEAEVPIGTARVELTSHP
jgi:hypothetical protein